MVRGAEDYNDNLWEQLPAVLLFDILSRLSIKTLSKFKCVSKSWNHLISHDTSFHILHREKSITKKPCVLFVGYSFYYTLSFTSIDMEGNRNINYTYTMPVCNRFCCPPICCDLFCFASGWNIYLCNPSMRQVHTLPGSNSFSDPLVYLKDHIVGFGYIASKREYVVVSLFLILRSVVNEDKDGEVFSDMNPFNPCENSAYNISGEVLCEMYTFCPDNSVTPCSINHRSSPYYPYGSSWRAINDVCPRWVDQSGLVVNTSMYWLIERSTLRGRFAFLFSEYERKSNELIISLDIEAKKFEIICCPPAWESPESETDDWSISLVDLKGTLCVANASFIDTSVLELWALMERNDDRNGGSSQARIWVKEYSITLDIPLPSLEVHRRLIYPKSSRNGEILLSSPVLNKFYIYNVEKGILVREVSVPFEEQLPSEEQLPVELGFCWESFLTL